MSKKWLIFIILAIFVLRAQAMQFDDSIGAINGNETVKVDVEISKDSHTGLFHSSSLDKNATLNYLEGNYDVDYVSEKSIVTIEANESELDELRSRPDVSSITKSIAFHTTLQDSTVIINSTLAGTLEVNGVNLTGVGQTVCIIDSGINYSHPAFGGCTKDQFLGGNCSKVIGGYAYYAPVNASNLNDVMGDSDHGTHVAGIVAGNGPLRGVASDAKIVAVKACNSAGNCQGNAILDAINWCTANAGLYNITVISMSLGTDENYTSSCDSEIPQFTDAINAATAKNIAVVAASGNSRNKTAISLPGCISNVTAVGATNKDDTIAFYSNRNALSFLMAPGTNINSSFLNGGYGIDSGTSMATPHVAGAFLIFRQLLDGLNVSMQPKQIALIFNETGKKIVDTTGVFYSRINVYDAVTAPPKINLIYPAENFSTLNSTITFSANISDLILSNITFQLRNESGDLLNESTFNISGSINQSDIIVYNLSNGTYNWSFIGSNSRSVFTIQSRNLTIGIDSNSSNVPEEAPAPPSPIKSRSSGGGGGGATTFTPKDEEVEAGYTKSLGKQEVVQFTLFDSASSKHTLTVNSIGKDYVNITVRSTPIKLTLGVGQSAKLNLTSLDIYDLLVRLDAIVNGKAQLTIQTISERRPVLPAPSNLTSDHNFTVMNETPSEEPMPMQQEGRIGLYILILIGAIVLTAVVVHLMDMPRRRRLHLMLNHKL